MHSVHFKSTPLMFINDKTDFRTMQIIYSAARLSVLLKGGKALFKKII